MLSEKRLDITGVSVATGFKSLSAFSTNFKLLYGVSPSAWLRKSADGDVTEDELSAEMSADDASVEMSDDSVREEMPVDGAGVEQAAADDAKTDMQELGVKPEPEGKAANDEDNA